MVVARFPLVVRYAAFALLSTGVNWAAQIAVLRALPGAYAVYPALAAGTAAGFWLKYRLDKHYIFHHVSATREQEAWVLALYLSTSIVMTAMYLLSQALIYARYGEGATYYVCGTCVLLLGYATKFLLDDRFVFRTQPAERLSS